MKAKSEAFEKISRDTVCTCKNCQHNLARDCIKLNCKCCKDRDHSMILDGMMGYGSVHKK